jgi:hypothetical protein
MKILAVSRNDSFIIQYGDPVVRYRLAKISVEHQKAHFDMLRSHDRNAEPFDQLVLSVGIEYRIEGGTVKLLGFREPRYTGRPCTKISIGLTMPERVGIKYLERNK